MKKIFELGVSSDVDNYKNQSIVACNKLALALLSTGILFLVYIQFSGSALALHSILYLAVVASTLLLNHYKVFDLSRLVLFAGSILFIALIHTLTVKPGEPLLPGLYLGQFCFIIFPWLTIDFRETPLLISTSLLALLAFILQPFVIEDFNFYSGTDIFNTPLAEYSCLAVFLFLLIWALTNFSNSVQQNEENTKSILLQIEEKALEMARRQEELQKRINEVNATHEIEEQRSWLAQGVSKAIDLMRSKNENLYPELIKDIVKNLGASVGAIYSLNNAESEDKELKLEGCYAYDRTKYLDLSIPFGDGVIGQSCIDREIVYLSNIPPSFLELTSGMGDEPPSHLAIVPLLEEQNIAGVLEIASHHQFEEHQQAFLKQLSASVASFILANSVNEKIRLLIEQNQSQAEEMRAQEEEMMQNMEELQATQEEMSRKEKEYIAKIEELEKQAGEL